MSQRTTLPTDSNERKNYALLRGCLRYFPAALAGVALISKLGNDKHNPGEEMYHAREKSTDHGDCIVRHLMDLQDLLANAERANSPLTPYGEQQILSEASSLCWRALALSQSLHEKFGAPLAPGAKLPPDLKYVPTLGHVNDVGEFMPTNRAASDYDWDV